VICTNCLNRYYSGMPEERQHDPNVPDPYEPWCPQCEAHTDYAVSQVSAGESGSREKYTCKACGEAKFVHEMFILPTKKQISSMKAVGLWFPAICIPGIPLLFYFIGPDTEKAHSELIEAGGALSVFFLLWILLGWYVIKVGVLRRKKWLAWARECGYTGD